MDRLPDLSHPEDQNLATIVRLAFKLPTLQRVAALQRPFKIVASENTIGLTGDRISQLAKLSSVQPRDQRDHRSLSDLHVSLTVVNPFSLWSFPGRHRELLSTYRFPELR